MLPLFDAHCDTIYELDARGCGLRENTLHLDLLRLSRYAHPVQVFTLFSDLGEASEARHPAQNAETFRHLLSVFHREMDANRDLVTHCRSAADIAAAHRAGKTAAILAVEGGELLSGLSPEDVYDLGVRIVTLTWNYENSLGGSHKTGGGLTPKGRDFVCRAGELGILIDVSHASDALFWDVAELATQPFLASHSNARAVCGHSRNLTDQQFQALCRSGGVAGLNLYADFLSNGPCTICDAVRHIEHFLALGGAKHIALGGDLDGCDRLPAGIRGVQDLCRIGEELSRLGYSDDLIHDLFYNNLHRVFSAVTG